MKNVVCISGSSRKGNSDYIAKLIKSNINTAQFNLRTILLSEQKFEFCDGCLTCDETGQCHIEDGMNEVNNELIKADTLIFITPARWALLTASLKNFFDRTNSLAVPGSLEGKNAYVIALGQTTQEESDSIQKAANSVSNFVEDAGMNLVDSIIFEELLNSDDAQNSDMIIDSINELCNTLI